MVCRTRPEPPLSSSTLPSHRGRSRCVVVTAALAAALLSFPPSARGDERLQIGGLLDAEVWKTDDASLLLERNDGKTAPGGALRLWAVAGFHERLQGFALGEIEGGKANLESGSEHELEQAYVRFTFKPERRMSLEAGKMVTPIGNFSRRYLSNVNPVI